LHNFTQLLVLDYVGLVRGRYQTMVPSLTLSSSRTIFPVKLKPQKYIMYF